jgi:modulator of FtsH protease
MDANLAEWTSFFQGELGAAAALAGLLFVSVSVNQARILALGRMADRGLEALVMLLLVIVVASLPLVPGQPARWLGGEILMVGLATLIALAPLQRTYVRQTEAAHRRSSTRMVWLNRAAIALIALGGGALAASGRADALYILPPGILLVFVAVGANAWVLLIEINR